MWENMAKRNQLTTGVTEASIVRSELRCLVCNSPARVKVDKLLVAGFSNTSVAQELMESDENFAEKELDTVRKNIERHSKSHLDIRNRAVREIVDRRAREQGILVDSAIGQITSGRALLDLLIAKATEQAGNPASKVHYRDAIEAVKMLEDVQKQEYMYQLEELQKQVWAISQAVLEKVPKDLLPEVVARAHELRENPQLVIEQ